MSLAVGTRLGPYEIVAPIGAGGMGEVYRARDTKLNRDVAIKVLPEDVAADPDRLARFEREAQALAALNHPNIAAVYAVEERAIVMELVAGEDLSARIQRGPIPLTEALPLARQIADALSAAHEAGIIHRDLKPANIKVKDDGTVKVLDFGLAKALDPPGEPSTEAMNSPTLTARATRMGVILGTAAYMAPEQARGRAVDKRADIWAFGVVLYEMLVGRRPFEGDDVTDVLAAVVRAEPDWTALPKETPSLIRRLLRRCLTKDAQLRLRDIADARLEIQEVLTAAHEAHASDVSGMPSNAARVRSRRIAGVVVPIVAAGIAAGATWLAMRPDAQPRPPVEFQVFAPADAPPRRGAGTGVVLSPDGRLLVYVADPSGQPASMLYVRHLDSAAVDPIPGSQGAFAPFFSPDSRHLGFFTDASVMRVPVAGGTPTRVTDKGPYSRATWTDGDSIVLGTSQADSGRGPLATVPARGGASRLLTTLGQGQLQHQTPHAVRGNRHVLFCVIGETTAELAVASVEDGSYRLLGMAGSDPKFVAPNVLVFARGDAIYRAPFDEKHLTITGPETRILPEASVYTTGAFSILQLDTDGVGTLAYLRRRAAAPDQRLAWMDARGRETPIPLESARYGAPRVSPDGRQFAVGVTSGGRQHIRVVDAQSAVPVDLDFQGNTPIWSPGGGITFVEAGGVLARGPADGRTPAERFLTIPDGTVTPYDWSPDGLQLLVGFLKAGSRGSQDRNIMVVGASKQPQVLLDSPADESAGRLSPPDGRWLAYQATESGRTRVYVRPFSKAGGTTPVCSGECEHPVWDRSGRALYFIQSGRLMKALLDPVKLNLQAATEMFELPAGTTAFDVTPDGRFLLLIGSRGRDAEDIRVVLGWAATLGKK